MRETVNGCDAAAREPILRDKITRLKFDAASSRLPWIERRRCRRRDSSRVSRHMTSPRTPRGKRALPRVSSRSGRIDNPRAPRCSHTSDLRFSSVLRRTRKWRETIYRRLVFTATTSMYTTGSTSDVGIRRWSRSARRRRTMRLVAASLSPTSRTSARMSERDHEVAMGKQSKLTRKYDGRGGAHNAKERRVHRGVFRTHCGLVCRVSVVESITGVFTGCTGSSNGAIFTSLTSLN